MNQENRLISSDSYYKNLPINKVPLNETTKIIKNHDAYEFHKTLSEYNPTPLIELPYLSKKLGVKNIYVKDESKRFNLNVFKGLGASYAISQSLIKNPDIKTFCTATDGNHGRAVAWAAKRNGRNAVVFVPKETTLKRIETIENLGAQVIQITGHYDQACEEAEKTRISKKWSLIQDKAWEGYIEIPALILSGYLTLFKEMEETIHSPLKPKIDLVFLQAGVGSMAAAGIYYYLNRYGKNKPKIVIIQPEEADGILCSFKEKKISSSKGSLKTIMAGLNCETPSLGAWDLLKNGTNYVLKISDDYAKQAMREFYYPQDSDKRIISGESGAAGLGGFLTILKESKMKLIKEDLKINNSSNILFINSEGDTDKEVFSEIINSNI
jgi:diaminopropionate ammonia-lyase